MDLNYFKIYSTVHSLPLDDDNYNEIQALLTSFEDIHNTELPIHYVYKTIEYEGNYYAIVLTNVEPSYGRHTFFNIHLKHVEEELQAGYVIFDTLCLFTPSDAYFSLIDKCYWSQPKSVSYTEEELLNSFLAYIRSESESRYYGGYRFSKDSLSDFYSLFDAPDCPSEDISEEEDEYLEDYGDEDEGINYGHIIGVISSPDNSYRIAIFKKGDEKDNSYYDQNLYALTATPNDPIFNYMDVGRRVYHSLWVDDNIKPDIRELDYINRYKDKSPEEFITLGSAYLLTSKTYEKYKKIIKRDLFAIDQANKIEESKREKIKKIKDNLDVEPYKRNGYIISKKRIQYHSLSFSHSIVSDLVHSLNLFDDLDFEDMYHSFCNHLVNRSPLPLKFKVNDFEVTLAIKGNLVYVNDIKIRKKDVEHVLKEAINYSSKEEYNARLSEVSRINLDVQKATQDGISISIPPFTSDSSGLPGLRQAIKIFLPTKLEGHRLYVTLCGKDYKVKCFNDLYDLSSKDERPQYHRSTDRFDFEIFVKKLFKGIPDLEHTAVSNVLKEAMANEVKAAKERKKAEAESLKRGQEFLAHAVKLTKTDVIDNITATNLPRFGLVSPLYSVVGKSGTNYIVDSEARVYKLEEENLHYLCFVDTGGYKSVVYDRIARRLYMLHQDLLVVNLIGPSDTHWKNMMHPEYSEHLDRIEKGYDVQFPTPRVRVC